MTIVTAGSYNLFLVLTLFKEAKKGNASFCQALITVPC